MRSYRFSVPALGHHCVHQHPDPPGRSCRPICQHCVAGSPAQACVPVAWSAAPCSRPHPPSLPCCTVRQRGRALPGPLPAPPHLYQLAPSETAPSAFWWSGSRCAWCPCLDGCPSGTGSKACCGSIRWCKLVPLCQTMPSQAAPRVFHGGSNRCTLMPQCQHLPSEAGRTPADTWQAGRRAATASQHLPAGECCTAPQPCAPSSPQHLPTGAALVQVSGSAGSPAAAGDAHPHSSSGWPEDAVAVLSPIGGVQGQVGPLGRQRAPRLPSPVACNDQENRRPSSTGTDGLQVRQNGLTMGASFAQLQPAL